MLEQAMLEAMQGAFWQLYVISVTAAILSFAIRRQWCLGRTAFAMVVASLVQTAVEGATGTYLAWWQHMMIDVPVFIAITMPPRHYWQATMGALVFAQLVLHAIWGVAPDFARAHWFAVTLIGFFKCGVLLMWSGGARVEAILGRAASLIARLVPDKAKGVMA